MTPDGKGVPDDPAKPMTKLQKLGATVAVLGFFAFVYLAGQWEPERVRPDPPREEYEREWGR
jgi:hypothetical protein